MIAGPGGLGLVVSQVSKYTVTWCRLERAQGVLRFGPPDLPRLKESPAQCPHEPRRQEPADRARAPWLGQVDVDPADRALIEQQRLRQAGEMRGECADARLMADERDVIAARLPPDF